MFAIELIRKRRGGGTLFDEICLHSAYMVFLEQSKHALGCLLCINYLFLYSHLQYGARAGL